MNIPRAPKERDCGPGTISQEVRKALLSVSERRRAAKIFRRDNRIWNAKEQRYQEVSLRSKLSQVKHFLSSSTKLKITGSKYTGPTERKSRLLWAVMEQASQANPKKKKRAASVHR